MLTSTDLISQDAGNGTGLDLAQRGEALLQAVDFRFSDGLAQLSVKTGPDDVYIVRLDLAEAVSDLREPANYRFALILLGLWVFLPALFSIMKRSRDRTPRPSSAFRSPRIGAGASGAYHHVSGLTITQLARILQGAGAAITISGATLVHILKGNVRIKRYRPRHAAAGGRRKTMIIDIQKGDGFPA